MENNQALWEKIITHLRAKVSHANLITWFKNTALIGRSADSLTIASPTAFATNQLSGKFDTQILDAAKAVDPQITQIAYRTDPTLERPDDTRAISFAFLQGTETPTKAPRKLPNKPELKIGEHRSLMLNPKYTLENFVTGPDNRLAHAAASVVAKTPGKKYNPLFIYGSVGMGKTHLLQAVGNEALRQDPSRLVIYQTSEAFMNEYTQSIQKKKMEDFKKKYRQVDLLLLDDIQFFRDKKSTQEEFFHTFNALYMGEKQIVLTADTMPKDLGGLEERLISRFSSGMLVEVQMPDFPTRLAILQEKCYAQGVQVPTDVLEYIAANSTRSVRELEGTLTRVLATSELEQTTPTVASVMTYFTPESKTEDSEQKIDLSTLTASVAKHYDLSVKDLQGKSRLSRISLARQVVMYLGRLTLHHTLQELGQYFQRDHATVIHSLKKIEQALKEDAVLVKDINTIKKSLGL